MSNPRYYYLEKPTRETLLSKLQTMLLTEVNILADEASKLADGEAKTFSLYLKTATFLAEPIAQHVDMVREGEYVVVGDSRIAIDTLISATATYAVTKFVSDIATALIPISLPLSGVIAVGAVVAAGVGISYLYSSYVAPEVNKFVDWIYDTEDVHIELRSTNGEIAAGAFYINGVSKKNKLDEIVKLLDKAKTDEKMDDPALGMTVEFQQKNKQPITYHLINSEDFFEKVAKGSGDEIETLKNREIVVGQEMVENEELLFSYDESQKIDLVRADAEFHLKVKNNKNMTGNEFLEIEYSKIILGEDLAGITEGGTQVVFGTNHESLEILEGNKAEKLYAYGGDGEDLILGSEGDDILFGEKGKDDILGFKGDDYLEGGDDDDNLFGGEGSDILVGGEGRNTYYGGAGHLCRHGNDGEMIVQLTEGR